MLTLQSQILNRLFTRVAKIFFFNIHKLGSVKTGGYATEAGKKRQGWNWLIGESTVVSPKFQCADLSKTENIEREKR